ncbi:MAG: aminopeptidase P family protein [Coriobacteriales bacterium]|jgi:Xaa-Pro aminopeptidase|nr:aminopeptidase P family protein [Coriobacteriales bacterium]
MPKSVPENLSAFRLSQLHLAMQHDKLDALLVTDVADIRWLTNFHNVFDKEPAHMLLVPTEPDGDIFGYIKTDSRYSEAMRINQEAEFWQIDDKLKSQSEWAVALLNKINKKKDKKVLKVGIDERLALNRFRALQNAIVNKATCEVALEELASYLMNMRAIKHASEIEILKQAQEITDAAFSQILKFVKPGMTEIRIASELEYIMRNLGGEGLAFLSIVASGPNSALPHAIPGQREVCKGDFLLFDFGACKGDYCSDMSRTIVIGKASRKQKHIFQTVLMAQQEAMSLIKADVAANIPALAVNEIFKERGYENLIHGLGHSVGIEVHELPVLSVKAKTKLVAGNIVTVEPGIYIQGFGGVRIEDFGEVTASGFMPFTKSQHELIEL